MRFMNRLCLCFALLLTLASALAEIPEPSEAFYVLDDANVLSETTENEICASNRLLNAVSGAQIVVVTVSTTGETAIDDYAHELFNRWGIGDVEKNNGLLLLLAIDDENYYSIPGDGLRTVFTSSTLVSMFDHYLEDDFAAGHYDDGVRRFFEVSYAMIKNLESDDKPAANSSGWFFTIFGFLPFWLAL